MSQPKTFDDAGGYERDIRVLVPGYDVLHVAIPAMLRASRELIRRVLVVGCGTGREAIAIARALEGCELDCVDPSRAMIEHARQTFHDVGLASRIRARACSLGEFAVERPYDAIVSTLVGHFIPDDGARAAFFEDIGTALRPGGIAVLTELERSPQGDTTLLEAHVECSRMLGAGDDQIATLHQRLSRDFHSLERERWLELAAAARLYPGGEFFRCFDAVGLWFVKG